MMIGNRKEEGRVCTVQLHIIRKSPMPSKNSLTAVLCKKALVHCWIQTQLAQTECHCSTAWTTVIANLSLTWNFGPRLTWSFCCPFSKVRTFLFGWKIFAQVRGKKISSRKSFVSAEIFAAKSFRKSGLKKNWSDWRKVWRLKNATRLFVLGVVGGVENKNKNEFIAWLIEPRWVRATCA